MSDIDVQSNPHKKHCSSSTSKPPSKSGAGIRRYNKKSGKNPFPGYSLMKIYGVHSSNYANRVEDLFSGLVGAWITPFTDWKKATQKMKSH